MINCIFVIIGTIIGAGFASGKEIFTFFNVYGFWGLFGLLISAIFMGLVIYKTFYIIINYNIKTFSDFINRVITKSSFLHSVLQNIMNVFLFISFIVMISGFSAYFSQEFNLSPYFGAIFIAILCFITFTKNIDGIIKINKYFIPFLLLIILFLGLKNIAAFSFKTYYSTNTFYNWLISAIFYASYNLIILIPILISLKNFVKNIITAKIVSLITIFFLFFMSSIIFFLLNYYFNEIQNVELPTIYISSISGNMFKYICGFVILGAIFTTAISSGYAFLTNLNIQSKKVYLLIAFFICFVSILLSNIGFANLVNFLYPILGFLRFCRDTFYTVFS